MQDNEREEFARVLGTTIEVYGQRLSTDAVAAWWAVLAPYSISEVRRALTAHMQHSVYPPKPADVVGYIQKLDGRPDADEAWNVALQAMDEDATVVWNDEIAEAKTAADPIWAEGDKVGARMAFIRRYERLVAEARNEGRPCRWWLTPGQDGQERAEKAQQALEDGRISEAQALPHLDRDARPAAQIAPSVREALEDQSHE